MKKLFCVLGLSLGSTAALVAQVSVEILLEQEQFLRDETLIAGVRIVNHSGQTLQLGRESDWLTFAVQSREGHRVRRLEDPPVEEAFVLESAQAAVRRVNLMPCFDLSQPGRYVVTATVRIAAWNEEVESKPRTFQIIPGVKIWEQSVGIPAAGGAPEVRKYMLQQASHLNKSTILYVRLTDEIEQTVFRVFPVGPIVSFARPEPQLDKESNLHLLFQSGARSFLYHVINPQGQVLVRQTHDYVRTRPALRSGEDGLVFVSGGLRRITPTDLPPPPVIPTHDALAPQP